MLLNDEWRVVIFCELRASLRRGTREIKQKKLLRNPI